MEEHSESKKLKLEDVVVVSGVENVTTNPLLNTVVIKKVFESLATSLTTTTTNSCSPSRVTLDDLKNFRLVCKSWHEETVKLWRQSATLKIIGDCEDNRFNHRNMALKGMGVKRFLQYWDADTKQLRTRPFARFNISGLRVNRDSDSNSSRVLHINHRFWNLIKDRMEHLRVENCEFNSGNFYKEFRDFLRMSKPNLRSFVLKDLKFLLLRHWHDDGVKYFYVDPNVSDSEQQPIGGIGHEIPDPADAEQQKADFGCGENLRSLEVIGKVKTASWKDVVKNSPNLETLRIGSWEQMKGITEAIRSGGQQGQCHLSKLRQLCVGAPVNYVKHHFLNLLTCNPPLETLSILILYPTWLFSEQDIALHECFEKAGLSETLRTLHVTCYYRWWHGIGVEDNDPFHDVQVSSVLKELCIWGSLVDSMNFLRLFPNLEILKINLSLFEKREELDRFQKESANAESMEEFRTVEGYTVEVVDIVQLTTETELHMNNLTHFRYDLDKLPVESWRLLGTWMPNLRKLEAVLTNETVAIVCEQWPNLWELGCLFGSTLDDEGVVTMATGGGSQNRSLTNLSNLWIEYGCGLGKLTDACVSGGFLEMNFLTHLEILNCPKMTDDSLEKLNAKIQCVRIRRSCPAGSRKYEDFECCQRKKFDKDFYLVRDEDEGDDDAEADSNEDEDESPTI